MPRPNAYRAAPGGRSRAFATLSQFPRADRVHVLVGDPCPREEGGVDLGVHVAIPVAAVVGSLAHQRPVGARLSRELIAGQGEHDQVTGLRRAETQGFRVFPAHDLVEGGLAADAEVPHDPLGPSLPGSARGS